MRFEDIEEVFEKIKKFHPNMFFNITEERFEREMEWSKSNWENLDIYGQIYEAWRLTALLGDAHIKMGFRDLPDDGYQDIYPFLIKKLKEGYCIVDIDVNSMPQEMLYTKVVGINGIPIEEIIEISQPIISTENGVFNFEFERYLTSRLFYKVLGIDDGNKITLTLQNEEKTFDVVVKALGKNHKVKPTIKPSVYYSLNDLNDYCYLKINRFKINKKININKIYTEVEKAVNEEKPIIVDVRENSGGKYRIFSYLWEILEKSKAKGYCLVDHNSYSASVMTAQKLRNIGFTIVGEPMGQPSTFNGAIFSNGAETRAGIKLRIPTVTVDKNIEIHKTILPAGFKFEENPLIPDVIITQSLEDKKNNKDAMLDYCVKQIHNQNKTNKISYEETEFCR